MMQASHHRYFSGMIILTGCPFAILQSALARSFMELIGEAWALIQQG